MTSDRYGLERATLWFCSAAGVALLSWLAVSAVVLRSAGPAFRLGLSQFAITPEQEPWIQHQVCVSLAEGELQDKHLLTSDEAAQLARKLFTDGPSDPDVLRVGVLGIAQHPEAAAAYREDLRALLSSDKLEEQLAGCYALGRAGDFDSDRQRLLAIAQSEQNPLSLRVVAARALQHSLERSRPVVSAELEKVSQLTRAIEATATSRKCAWLVRECSCVLSDLSKLRSSALSHEDR